MFLTVGKEIITSDPRFEVAHIADSPDWNLMISNLSTADAGAYECQISSTDKNLRKEVYLNVKGIYTYADCFETQRFLVYVWLYVVFPGQQFYVILKQSRL